MRGVCYVSVSRKAGVGEVRARARLRLILGMRLLERLNLDSCPVGQRFPSIRAVAAASGTHRNTVAAAYSDLAALGLIRCEAGSGSFVSHPPAGPYDTCPRRLTCHEAEMARLLSAELGMRATVVSIGDEASATDGDPLLLHPLDLVPSAEHLAYPVAPCGETLALLRCLRPGSTVVVVSQSPSARRLMRSTIRAVHGARVGVAGMKPEVASGEQIVQRIGAVPAVVFHDPGWSPGNSGIVSCPLRFLITGLGLQQLAGTPRERRSYG